MSDKQIEYQRIKQTQKLLKTATQKVYELDNKEKEKLIAEATKKLIDSGLLTKYKALIEKRNQCNKDLTTIETEAKKVTGKYFRLHDYDCKLSYHNPDSWEDNPITNKSILNKIETKINSAIAKDDSKELSKAIKELEEKILKVNPSNI